MTIKELSTILEESYIRTYKRINKLFPELMKQGQPLYLDEDLVEDIIIDALEHSNKPSDWKKNVREQARTILRTETVSNSVKLFQNFETVCNSKSYKNRSNLSEKLEELATEAFAGDHDRVYKQKVRDMLYKLVGEMKVAERVAEKRTNSPVVLKLPDIAGF